MNKSPTILIFALASLGGGLSGGDRIFIEFARYWSKRILVHLYVWEEGLLMCQREKLNGKHLRVHLIKAGVLSSFGFILVYFYRILLGAKLGLTLKLQGDEYIYSASEFWMDSLPAFILKLRYPRTRWVAAWYQTAPSPFKGFTEGNRKKRYRWNAFLYWFMQQPIKPLISKFADFVFINNEIEKKQFPSLSKRNRVSKRKKAVVIKGAVNVEAIARYLSKYKSTKTKEFLAVYQGRFHPQKAVLELIDIWKLVTHEIADAKLAMIGDGPLMKDVKKRIRELHLGNNIQLFGYLHDGVKKYSIFRNSYIAVHPSFYDSGGMAAIEAMAFGLPCVGFNLAAYPFYHPQGMIKVPIGNLKEFANEIVKLNNDKYFYSNMNRNVRNMIMKEYSWAKRADEVLNIIDSAQ